LDSFGNSKGKIGHYSEYKRFTFHALGFSIAFLMRSWTGEHRQEKRSFCVHGQMSILTKINGM